MSKSQSLKELHQRQTDAANEQFEMFKPFIVREFVKKYGGSYQMPEQHIETWRQEFDWTPEGTDFLIEKAKLFLNLLPNNQELYDSPKCLNILTSKICAYLVLYTRREDEPFTDTKKSHEKHLAQLKNILFTKNPSVQYKIEKYKKHYVQVYAGMMAVKGREHDAQLLQKREESEIARQQRIKEATNHFRETGELPQDVNIFHTPAQLTALKNQLYGPDQNQYS